MLCAACLLRVLRMLCVLDLLYLLCQLRLLLVLRLLQVPCLLWVLFLLPKVLRALRVPQQGILLLLQRFCRPADDSPRWAAWGSLSRPEVL